MFSLIVSLFLTACTLPAQYRPTRPAGDHLDSQEMLLLLQALSEGDQSVESYRGLANSTFLARGEKAVLRHLFLFQRPSQARIEAFPTSGFYTLNLLVLRAGGFTFLEPSQRLAVSGDSARRGLFRILRINADSSELMSIFSGSVPSALLDSSLSRGALQAIADKDAPVIHLILDNFRYYWILDSTSLAPLRLEMRDPFQERLTFAADFSDFRYVDNRLLPFFVRLDIAAEDSILELDFSSISINSPLRPDLFEVEIPSNFEQRNF